MCAAVRFGHQYPDILPDHLLRRVTEKLLSRAVKRLHDAAFVNDGNGVNGSVNRRAVFRLVGQSLCFGEFPVGRYLRRSRCDTLERHLPRERVMQSP